MAARIARPAGQFTCQVGSLPPETFQVCRFEGHQSISHSPIHSSAVSASPWSVASAVSMASTQMCHGFFYQIQLISDSLAIDPQSLIDQSACLSIKHRDQSVSYVDGVIRFFAAQGIGKQQQSYQLCLVPALERLGLRHNMRIFQQQTAQEIMQGLFAEMAITNYRFDLQRSPVKREFCMQYRRSDLEFFHRLAAEEGWMYYFKHQQNSHQLIITDSVAGWQPPLQPSVLQSAAAGQALHPHIHSFSEMTQQAVGQTWLQDRSFKMPQQPLACVSSHGNSRDEYYDWGQHKDPAVGQAQSQFYLDYLRRESHCAFGSSDLPGIQAGYGIDIQAAADEVLSPSQADWTVVYSKHQGQQPSSDSNQAAPIAYQYHNQFIAVPAQSAWRAPPPSINASLYRPDMPTGSPHQPHCPEHRCADHLLLGQVVGPAGEEIYCDQHGRVKVDFIWDRDSQCNETSSCWIRVAQSWAGGAHGMMALPRVGDQVLISFVHGDPDQPIISGRAYHAVNKPPRDLPAHKTQTVFAKTKTYLGEGFNELRTEDQSGEEQIYVHAQKDHRFDVKHDHKLHIEHDKKLTIANDQTSHIQHDLQQQIDHDSQSEIKHDENSCVDHNEKINIKHDAISTVDHDADWHIQHDFQCEVLHDQHSQVQQDKTLILAKDHATHCLHNYDVIVDNHRYVRVKNNQHINIDQDDYQHAQHDGHQCLDGDHYLHVEHDQHQSVSGNSQTEVMLDYSLKTGGHLHQQVGKSYALEVLQEVHFWANQSIVMEAAESISFKVGASFITLNASGVHHSSKQLNFNNGGSPLQGLGFVQLPVAFPDKAQAMAAGVAALSAITDAIDW